MSRDSIIVVGAGIIGLSVALELSKRGHGHLITVIAEHMPGDLSINYTSPWAGANFSAISGSNPNALRWDEAGYRAMWDLIEEGKVEAKYLEKTKSTEYFDNFPEANKIASMKTYLKDIVILPASALPSGVAFGITFTTITINAPEHIKHLQNLLSSPAYGSVRFVRRRLPSLRSAFILPKTKIVFNCVGNAARTFDGVEDPQCFPTRGQVVLVKAPQVRENVMRHGQGYETYIIPRPNSGGNVILGGYMQKHNGSGDVYSLETDSILSRTKELLPILHDPVTEVLVSAAGLRPSREDGARVEREDLHIGKCVIHNYGAGGTGYQAGIGMAKDAVDLAERDLDALQSRSLL